MKNPKMEKMKIAFWKQLFITGVLILTATAALYAQESDNLSKELVLVRPYEPSVVDAQKISPLPDLNDTARVKPTFKYTIKSRRIDIQPDITPITPAKLQPLPLNKLYHSYVKAGIGTGMHPMLDVALNSLRNDKFAAGVIVKYDGMFGNVKLENEKSVYAGYSDANVKLFGQKFYRSSYLYGDAGIGNKIVHNYGYQPGIDTLMLKDEVSKSYTFADARIGLRSSHYRTSQLNYNVQGSYGYTGNKTDSHGDLLPFADIRKFKEHDVNVNAQLDNNMFGGNIDFEYYTRSEAFDSLHSNFALSANPWFVMDNDSIRLEVGMRASLYKEGKGVLQYKIYPKVEFQFTLLKDVFIPFLGIDGSLKTNTYRDIIEENPFITPGLSLPITNMKLNIYGGLKGAITSKLSYYLRANFTTSDREMFFVNDTAYSKAQNYFNIITDNVNKFNIGAEIYYNPNERLELRVKANYDSYELSTQSYAWHCPMWSGEFSAKYKYRKLLFNLDAFAIGQRYAKAFEPNVDYYKLKGVLDFNFGVEYQYLRRMSFFVKFNNFTGNHYNRWNFYPSQKFNVMGGFTFSL
ncbi:MAG: hypothetical protein LBU62_06280 [Bacteroidales bacterium]|jgi:hypothetical protein|nr:hypothetical protein [Bacteroidales bacterium]